LPSWCWRSTGWWRSIGPGATTTLNPSTLHLDVYICSLD
jgi:hypothetical protein